MIFVGWAIGIAAAIFAMFNYDAVEPYVLAEDNGHPPGKSFFFSLLLLGYLFTARLGMKVGIKEEWHEHITWCMLWGVIIAINPFICNLILAKEKFDLVSLLFSPIVLIHAFLGPLLVPLMVGVGLPFFPVGLYVLFTQPEVARLTDKAANTRRPSDVIEAEMAQALRSGLANDAELARLIHELPPWSRWWKGIVYRIEARKYRKARELLDLQHDAMKERLEAAKDVHELERTKRH